MSEEADHQVETGRRVALADSLVIDAVREAGCRVVRIRSVTVHLWHAAGVRGVRGHPERVCAGTPETWRTVLTDRSGQTLGEVVHVLDAEPAGAPGGAGGTAVRPQQGGPAPADSRLAQIARAAANVIAEKGYAAATMREIATAAGMHVPTMYQYVPSKEAMLELVYRDTIERALAQMAPVLAEPGTPAERLEAIVRQLVRTVGEMRRETGVLNRETRSLSPPVRERVLGRYGELLHAIAEVIAEAQRDGTLASDMDPFLTTQFIDALADVRALRPFAVGRHEEAIYEDTLVRFVLRALKA